MKLENLSFDDLKISEKLKNVTNKEQLDIVYSEDDIFFKIYFTISQEICRAL